MRKLGFIIGLLIFVVADAHAFMAQSASKALSYKNTVSGVIHRKPAKEDLPPKKIVKRAEKKEIARPAHQVDIKTRFSGEVQVTKGEEIEVILQRENNYEWVPSYNQSEFIITRNEPKGSIHVMRFIPRANGGIIFFDCINSKGNTIKNKAVDVKVE